MMEADASLSKNWLSNSLLPSVLLVESTNSEKYEAACSTVEPASGGSLLRLLDSRRGSKRPIEFLTPSTKMSQMVRVRFCAPMEFSLAKDSRSIDNTLFQAVASVNPEKRRFEMPYPWFSSFRKTLLQATTTWKEISDETGSTLALPLVLLLAISAAESDPVTHLAQMLEKEPLSGSIPRLVIVVSTAETTQQELEMTMKLTKAAFGADSVALVRLDSEKALEESFHELMTRIILVTQRRVFSLNEVVASQKKGLGNTIRSLFGGGSSSAPAVRHPTTRESKVYPSDSVPYKVRLLADLLFWMRDYESALTNYSYVRDDYQRDEAHMHHGSVCEMIAMCSFLARGPPPSFEEGSRRVELIDRAVESYFKGTIEARPSSTAHPLAGGAQTKRTMLGYRLATRASLLLLEIAPKNTFSNIKILMKALSHEDELCAAVLLEQIALLMLDAGVAKRGMRRKSGFNLLHAGALYRSLGLDRHAFRCYSVVHETFFRRGWPAAEHHLEVNLGNLSRNLSDMQSLVDYRGYSLERGYEIQNSNQHVTLLKEFVEAIESLPSSSKPLRHQVPRVEYVMPPKSQAELDVEEIETKSLADAPSPSHINNESWQSLQTSLQQVAKHKKRRSTRMDAYVKEPLLVQVTFFNPLNCDITLFDMMLMVSSGASLSPAPIKLDAVSISPKSSLSVKVGIIPAEMESSLKLHGVSWKLSKRAQVRFEHEFTAGPSIIEVLASSPCLHGRIVPSIEDSGEKENVLTVELKNVGANELAAGSRILIANEDTGAMEWSLAPRSGPKQEQQSEVVDERGLVTALLIEQDIRPGETVGLRCLVHNHALSRSLVHRCAIMYGIEGRIARLIFNRENVRTDDTDLVSLSGRFMTTSDNDYLALIDVDSVQQPIQPLGISCFSPAWRIAPVKESALFPASGKGEHKWSVAVRVVENPTELSSYVSLDGVGNSSSLGTLSPVDYQLRCHHANAVYEERQVLRQRIEQERAELEAKGQLPVSIQDVRRARQRGELQVISDIVTHYPPGSMEAVRERRDLIHLALDYVLPAHPNRVHRAFLTRLVVQPPPLTVSFVSLVPKEIRLRPGQELCEVSMTVRVANVSKTAIAEDVCLTVGTSPSSSLHDRFPRPTYWIGPTRKCWKQILPGRCFDVTVAAVFTSSGVFAIGPFMTEYVMGKEQNRFQQELRDERFVTVVREEIDDEELFKQVEEELVAST